jgi:outer membrane protein assembly complex protein YaeT
MSSSAGGFEVGRGRFFLLAFALCLALAVLGLGVPAAFPQSNPAALIAKVEVWVDGAPNTENLERLISIRPGDRYSLSAVSDSIKQVYQSQLVSDVEVVRSGLENVELRFLLTRKLIVRKIGFLGEKGTSRRKLRNSLYALREYAYFSEDKLSRATEELKRALNDEGYFQPKVEAAAERIPGVPQVDVVFTFAAGARYAISDIRFQGSAGVGEADLKRVLKTKEGDLYSLNRLDQDLVRLRELYAQRQYPRAEVELSAEDFFPENGTVSLLIRVDPDERIEIRISGAEVPVDLVSPIWEERIFEEWGLDEGEARILAYLRERGYVQAAVRSRAEREKAGLRIIHQVDPGKRARIQDIRFEGNAHFSADRIKKELGIADRVLFIGVLDGERAFELAGEIKLFYQIEGFPAAQVDLQFFIEGNKAQAVYQIQEGKQQRIRAFEIVGASLFDPELIRSQLSIVEGGPFFRPFIQREIERLAAFYLDQGVRGTRIEPRIEALEEDSFKVTFTILEGRPVRIQSLFVSGNLITRDNVVKRELRIKEGDLARADRISESKQNLERLGIFSEVTIEEIPVSESAEHVVITVREGERNYAGIGAGLETRDTFRSAASLLEASLRLRGTAEFMRGNMFGSAASLSLVTQFSLSEKRVVLTWQQPYFLFNIPIETYINGWAEAEDRISFAFEREGISITGMRPFFWGLEMLTTLGYARTTLTSLQVPPNEIDRQFYPYSKTSLAPSFIRERRDDAFNSGQGYFSSLALDWAFPLFQTESDFLKGLFKYQRYFTLVPRVLLGSTFRLGLGMGKMPIHERFFAGGSNSFRGAKFDELGPKDPESKIPIGGKALILFNFEFSFPVVSSLRNLSGLVFYDAGNAFYNRSDVDIRSLEHAVGLGVRYRTPLGPVRLELGWNLSDSDKRGKPIAFITIGNIF